MTVRFADIVDWDSLRNTATYGTIAGVGITAAYGFALLGLDRAQEKYKAGADWDHVCRRCRCFRFRFQGP